MSTTTIVIAIVVVSLWIAVGVVLVCASRRNTLAAVDAALIGAEPIRADEAAGVDQTVVTGA